MGVLGDKTKLYAGFLFCFCSFLFVCFASFSLSFVLFCFFVLSLFAVFRLSLHCFV